MKKIINIALAGIATAMGIVVIVLGVINGDQPAETYIPLLAIGIFALGLFCLNNLPKDAE